KGSNLYPSIELIYIERIRPEKSLAIARSDFLSDRMRRQCVAGETLLLAELESNSFVSFFRLDMKQACCCGYDLESDTAGYHRLHSRLQHHKHQRKICDEHGAAEG